MSAPGFRARGPGGPERGALGKQSHTGSSSRNSLPVVVVVVVVVGVVGVVGVVAVAVVVVVVVVEVVQRPRPQPTAQTPVLLFA